MVRVQDPKKSSNEKQFRIGLYGGQDDLDYMSLLAMMFGIMGLFLKYRIFIWQALMCCIMSVVNMKTSELDFRQVMSSFSISLMGLVMAYFGPQAHFFV